MKALKLFLALFTAGYLAFFLVGPEQPSTKRSSHESATANEGAPSEASNASNPPPAAAPIAERPPQVSPQRLVFADPQIVRRPSTPSDHSHILREWRGTLHPKVSQIARSLERSGSPQTLALLLPDGSQLEVLFEKSQRFDERRGVVIGSIPGSAYSEVIFSYVNDAVSGSITRPDGGKSYDISNAGAGQQIIAQIDSSKFGSCGLCQPATTTTAAAN